MFNKVLVPVDGSEASMKAVETARKLLEEGSAREVSLLYVVQASDVVAVNALELYDDPTIVAKQVWRRPGRLWGPKRRQLCCWKRLAGDIICRIARKDNYDLCHRQPGLKSY